MNLHTLFTGTLATVSDGDFPYLKCLEIKRDGTAVITNGHQNYKFSHYGASRDRVQFRAAEFVCRWEAIESSYGTNYLFFKSRETIPNIIPLRLFNGMEQENLIAAYDARQKSFFYKFQYVDNGIVYREMFMGTKALDESTNTLHVNLLHKV